MAGAGSITGADGTGAVWRTLGGFAYPRGSAHTYAEFAWIHPSSLALPELQRGYVRGLLVWATEANTATHRRDGPLAPGFAL
jgi:hypothetical protein